MWGRPLSSRSASPSTRPVRRSSAGRCSPTRAAAWHRGVSARPSQWHSSARWCVLGFLPALFVDPAARVALSARTTSCGPPTRPTLRSLYRAVGAAGLAMVAAPHRRLGLGGSRATGPRADVAPVVLPGSAFLGLVAPSSFTTSTGAGSAPTELDGALARPGRRPGRRWRSAGAWRMGAGAPPRASSPASSSTWQVGLRGGLRDLLAGPRRPDTPRSLSVPTGAWIDPHGRRSRPAAESKRDAASSATAGWWPWSPTAPDCSTIPSSPSELARSATRLENERLQAQERAQLEAEGRPSPRSSPRATPSGGGSSATSTTGPSSARRALALAIGLARGSSRRRRGRRAQWPRPGRTYERHWRPAALAHASTRLRSTKPASRRRSTS